MNLSPKDVRPRREWISALMDERKTEVSGIILAVETGAEKVTEGMATVVRIGPGIKAEKLGIEPGMRFMLRSYLKYANRIPTEETWPSGAAKEYFLMDIDDVFAEIDGVNVGVFSRPSQNSSKDYTIEDGVVKETRP